MTRCAAVVAFFLGAPLLLQAQAAVEYGLAAANSAAMTSKVPTPGDRIMKHIGAGIEHQNSNVAAPSVRTAAPAKKKIGGSKPATASSTTRAGVVVQGVVPKNQSIQQPSQRKYKNEVTISIDQ